jgi:hypothetical protein
MIATDTFSKFARRLASTQGCPYIVIAETPNPIRQLEHDALRARAEAMLATVIEGLTLPATEIERRSRDAVQQQLRPRGVVRSSSAI